MTKRNSHWGTTLDEFLDAEGIREEAKAEAVTRVVAWQLTGSGSSRASGPYYQCAGRSISCARAKRRSSQAA